jgi:nicotinate-nucleotide adenylyltransferase
VSTGIFGGTFDPVHNAHLAIAHAALNQLKLQKILFIPTGPTHYRTPAATPAGDRLAMLRLALHGEPRFEIDARELAPGATGYTVDTLRALKLDNPTLLMGADQYEKLDTWHRPDEIRRLARLAVFGRPGIDLAAGEAAGVKAVRIPPMDVSSTDIRARAARGEDISGLVPAAVASYVAEKGLYR